VLGRTVVWLVDYEWRDPGYGTQPEQLDESALVDEFVQAFHLDPKLRRPVRAFLRGWKASTTNDRAPADLIRSYYALLELLDVRALDLDDPIESNRLGTLARFSELLADYEAVHRRARVDLDNPGEQVGAQDRGIWYFRGLAATILNYATGAYEAFDGEADLDLDAIDITTVHRSKGLEWPVVLVPSLTKGRFPTGRAGRSQTWPVPRDLFDADRYEGGDAEERRLFYVAATRARDFVSLSRHDAVNVRRSPASPYWQEVVAQVGEVDPGEVVFPEIEARRAGDEATLQVSFSDIAAFLECGQAYRLRSLYGFQPRLAPELGYGKAVHHVLRMVAEQTKARGAVPSADELRGLLDSNFFLPAANKPAHKQLKAAAERLVSTYATDHEDDLFRVWETERPFELHLDGVVVVGRADVVLDKEGGVETALALVDYKTSTSGDRDHDLQLQVYADAGRREGLDVRGAYVHDLKAGARTAVQIDEGAISGAERTVIDAAAKIRSKTYTPNPGKQCRRCEVRAVCGAVHQ
jgi:DNA helicase-2/ATP-dependent DNA helicase PcrA